MLTVASLCDGEAERVSLFALTVEYYQTEALSHHRLAADSDMPIVQFFLTTRIATLFACHSFSSFFFWSSFTFPHFFPPSV